MTDRPILFSAPMVRALLDGRKTQTRRVLTPQPEEHPGMNCRRLHFFNKKGDLVADASPDEGGAAHLFTRFAVGDRLWVKETHVCVGEAGRWEIYRASGYEAECDRHGFDKPYPPESEIKWKPSIFMPRRLSRLTLTVTDVRVEQLQDCSEADAIAEGVHLHRLAPDDPYADTYTVDMPDGSRPVATHAYPIYKLLWNAINGPGAWEANPWVVAVTFDVRKENIDG